MTTDAFFRALVGGMLMLNLLLAVFVTANASAALGWLVALFYFARSEWKNA